MFLWISKNSIYDFNLWKVMEMKFMNKEWWSKYYKIEYSAANIFREFETRKKKRTTQATETVNKTERTRNQSIIKPERIANTERHMKWFSMMSSNISTETHTTGRDKQKVQK